MSKKQVSGFLSLKKGGFFGGYTKHYWLLDGKTLSFSSYPDPNAITNGSPLQTFRLVDIKLVKKIGKGSSFDVLLESGKSLSFKCADERERDRWVDGFTDILLNVMNDEGEKPPQVGAKTIDDVKNNSNNKKKSVMQIRGSDNQEIDESVEPSSPKRPMSMKFDTKGNAVPIANAGSKNDAVVMDQVVFMGKARNFAVSTNKTFTASIKSKGGVYKAQDNGEDGPSVGRAAVIPIMTAEEVIEKSRFEKTDEQKAKLLGIISNSLSDLLGGNLFKEVEASAIVDLFFTLSCKKDSNVVTQGEPTDRMYIVEEGIVGVYSQDFVDRPPELESEKKNGDFFGALTLLYNQPGPFTFKCHTDCVLWALPRRRFHELTTNETKKRANKKLRLLEGVSLIAKNLSPDEMIPLADSMESETYDDGKMVLKVGDLIKKLFIVAEGFASLQDKSGKELQELSKGDAYGDWALLDVGAKAEQSLVAKSGLVLLSLDAKEAQELIGPLRDYVLKRWVEERGADLFASHARGGTIFSPTSDIRNPMSRFKATVTFGNGKQVEGIVAGDPTKELKDDAAVNVVSLDKQKEEEIIKEAIDQAKSAQLGDKLERKTQAQMLRNTAAQKRKTESNKKKTEAFHDVKREEVVVAVKKEEEIVAPPPPDEDDEARDEFNDDASDEGDVEEVNLDKPFDNATPLRPELLLKSIKCCALLGRGNFGRVHLCRNESNHKELFALKVLSRHFIVQNGWEVLVENERNAMLELAGLTRSPFLLLMFNSFSDQRNVYLLLELCDGGDLYNLLRLTKGNRFKEDQARFYMGCVVMGLEAMHSREICYRDLKPENLMLSKNGYVKVADFGLAKKTMRTFTVCGTPDYMAPEVILSRGHGMPVDWWAIGVLLFEMISAVTPFFGNEAMDIYENVLAHEEENDLQFPTDVSFSADSKSLITKLLHPKKTRRLGVIHPGVQGVKTHAYFTNAKFNWTLLAEQKVVPPIMPQTVDMTKYTTGNNITYDPKFNSVPPDDSGWKLDF